MPKVWNKRDPLCPADAVYVGRPTPFGNPFTHLTKDTRAPFKVATREEAVRKYEEVVIPFVTADAQKNLRGKDLVCWCVEFGGVEWSEDRNDCHCFPLMKAANTPEEVR